MGKYKPPFTITNKILSHVASFLSVLLYMQLSMFLKP